MVELTEEQKAIIVEFVEVNSQLDKIIYRGEKAGLLFALDFKTDSQDPNNMFQVSVGVDGVEQRVLGDAVLALVRETLDRLGVASCRSVSDGQGRVLVPRVEVD